MLSPVYFVPHKVFNQCTNPRLFRICAQICRCRSTEQGKTYLWRNFLGFVVIFPLRFWSHELRTQKGFVLTPYHVF